ncbi:replication initiation protein [Endozoicomonas sp. SM1973]|uniref:Replication initiation protein n=1 Tax=Spartinivicinus marinus TaxID=2994442 RepID=A0A853IG27_9GAMM|nr:replication initiation protein [Spartinivicinus marinus]NYZ69498.1 replication initiation protein [Spartinivicinus marinus]
MSESDKRLVVKGNSFIDSYWNLSLAGHKVFAAMLANINPTSPEPPKSIMLNKKAIQELDTGLNRVTIQKQASSIIQELMEFKVSFDPEDLGDGVFKHEGFNVFESFSYKYRDKSGKREILSVELSFTDKALPLIHGLSENFMKYHIERIKKLESPYSVRLYEILRRYHPIKSRRPTSIVTIDLDELKRQMKVFDKAGYKRYNNFRQEILQRCQKDLEKNTDISFNFEGQRISRSIKKIMFIIKHNNVETVEETEGTVLPKHVDIELFSKVGQVLPNLNEEKKVLIFNAFEKDVIKEALFEFALAALDKKIDKPEQYFIAICKNKQKDADNSKQNNSDAKEQDDMSWADALDEF